MSHYQPAPNMVLMNLSTGQKFVGHEISERTAVIEATRGEFWTDAVEMQDCVIAVVIDERGKMSIAHFFNEDVADLNHQVVNFLGRLSVKPKLVNLIHSHSEILSYVKSAFAAQGISNNAINVSLAGNHNFYFGIKQENGKIEATAADNTQFGGFAVTHEDFIPRNEGHGVIKLVSQDRAMKSYGEQDRAADFSPPVVRRVAQMGQKSGPRNPLRIVLAGTGLREVKYTIQMLEGIEQNSPKLMFANIMAYSKSQETVQKIDENLRAVRKTGWKIELQAKDLLDTDSSLGQGDQDVIVSQNSFYLSRGLDTADKLFAEKQKEFVAKVARALRPGGIFVIEDSGAQDGDLSFIEQAGFRLLRFRGPMSQLVFERVDRAMNALSILKSYYEGALRENPKAAAYLKRRNIDPETLDHAIEETGKDVLREKLKDPKHPLIAFAGGTQSKVYRGMVEGNDIIVKNIKDPQAWSKYKEYQDRLGHNGFALVAGYLVFKDLKIYVDGRIVRIPHAVVQEEVVPLLDRVRTLRKTYQGSPEVLHREIDNLLNDYFELYKRLLSQGLVMKPDGFLVDTGLTKDNRVVVLDGGDLLTRQEASQEYDLENFNRSFIQALKADTIFVRYTPDGKKAEPVDTVAELGSTLDSFNFSVVQSANRDLSNGKALELLAQRPEIKRELYFGNY
ncbi:MAG: hypothetical protein KGJ11_09795, partial [Candidatus Omnitrophica bacterium]|nr:hypothetical protein [Candidatus Omnitrophota bacterium]